MNDHTIEIYLYPWGSDRYAVAHQYTPPDATTDDRPVPVNLPLARLTDRAALNDLADRPLEYGAKLWGAIFPEEGASREMFAAARAAVRAAREDNPNVYLRLRLCIGPGMPDLQDLMWESLPDPEQPDVRHLVLAEDVLFSRYVAAGDTRSLRVPERPRPRALVVIANPTDLDEWRPSGQPLAAIDWRRELDVAGRAFTEGGGDAWNFEVLVSGGLDPDPDHAPTFENLMRELDRDKDGYDVLYLVCHGAMLWNGPQLYLEHGPGGKAYKAYRVSGDELARGIGNLPRRPLLVYLASCQSGGAGARAVDAAAMASVGFQLARAGVPAVVAMQGDLTMDTAADFTPAFFQALRDDGRADRAMAVGRHAVGERRADRWRPVLLTRLKGGRLWGAPPAVAGPGPNIETTLHTLFTLIRQGQCTPILGPGVTDHVLGSRREIAGRWANAFRYPMAGAQREELPQVAQYLAVNFGRGYPRVELTSYLTAELDRYADRIPELAEEDDLDRKVELVGRWHRRNSEHEPHEILARLRCPIYITTNPDGLMADALAEELGGGAPGAGGRRPRVGTFDWRGSEDPAEMAFPVGYKPTRDEPLVYHLFGGLAHPDLMVLTQDDYFEYLIGATVNGTAVPAAVRRALNASCLLFLGFRLDDWKFRVLLHSIMNKSGQSLAHQFNHVAVQLDPEDDRIQDPEMARRYLEQMGAFQGAPIRIIWGDLKSFMGRLQARFPAPHPAGVPG